MDIGKKLRDARNAAKLTQESAAESLGVSRQTIARWEELGFISRSDIGIPGEKYFVIEEVISQLGKLKGVK